jgi:hypothetical protein
MFHIFLDKYLDEVCFEKNLGDKELVCDLNKDLILPKNRCN